jgi:hypothetical protein
MCTFTHPTPRCGIKPGDPRFNPQRNADGTISEVPPIIDVNNFHAGKMYTQDEVDKIIEERDRLQVCLHLWM